MTVYVDNMQAKFRNMIMCHMIADTREELLEFAINIGLKPSWRQKWDTHHFHFDISLSKRRQAIAKGAVAVTMRELGDITRARINGEEQ